jgi:excisionase family DNA binding protein
MDAKLLTKRDTAEHLRVSIRFVELQVQRKALAAIKIGRAIRFRPKDVEDFIEKRRLRAVA